MIVELTVENIAVIEHAQVSPAVGFTVLTGETGAGKSLLIDAIELALGERAASELVRSGSSRAKVSLVCDLSARPDLIAELDREGIPLTDNLLFIQREVSAEGRSVCRVGGQMTPVAALKRLGKLLVDLHGQHDHQSLLYPESHLMFLDSFAGEPARALRDEVDEHFRKATSLRSKLDSLRNHRRDRLQRAEFLRFQVEEIESAAIQPNEWNEVEEQLQRQLHAEKLAAGASLALTTLADGDSSAKDALAGTVKALEDLQRFDPSLSDSLGPLREALYQLEDGVGALRAYADEVVFDPSALEDLSSRKDLLARLRKKYGENEDAILDYLQSASEELSTLEDSEANEEGLEAELNSIENVLAERASALTDLRKRAAVDFATMVERELADLAMEKARFSVQLRSKSVDSSGADEVEFLFNANVGEDLKPLAKIASGGELSRVMLAIKTCLAGKGGVPTLIFDEVDSGLSGRTAAVVAKKLEELSHAYQVIVISHLPQVASKANSHFRIEKSESGGRVRTDVRLLDGDERVEEVARLLAGETIGESALANARELLAGAI
ncbi:MAG TPA: DNA repair protein RecN [Fimbriimonadaceae bacterium]|nr:DNA repair protein RecN [Fimbriimonadaceae bacterium]